MNELQLTADQWKKVRNFNTTIAVLMGAMGAFILSTTAPERKSEIELQEQFFRASAQEQVIEQSKPLQSAVDLAFQRASSGVKEGSVSYEVSGNVDIGKALAGMPAKQAAYEEEFQKQESARYPFLFLPAMFAGISLAKAAGAHKQYKKLSGPGPS